jgi:adenosylcobinamide-phosphate synthase
MIPIEITRGTMDHALLILSALLLNILLAGPRILYNNLSFMRLPSNVLRSIERKLNRERRSLDQRHMRGVVLVVAVMVFGLLTGWIGELIFKDNLRFVEIGLLAILLPVRPTWDFVSYLDRTLRAGNIMQAKKAFEGTAWRHAMLLDERGLARAGIEMLSVHFSEKIVAPIVWFFLFGLPGFLISKLIYLMVEILRPLNDEKLEEHGFSGAAVTVHYLMHYVPARLAALLWPMAVLFPPPGDPAKVLAGIMSGRLFSATPQSVSILAAASSLSLSLGGPASSYTGAAWEGSGTAKATPAHLKRAQQLFALLVLTLFLLLSGFL